MRSMAELGGEAACARAGSGDQARAPAIATAPAAPPALRWASLFTPDGDDEDGDDDDDGYATPLSTGCTPSPAVVAAAALPSAGPRTPPRGGGPASSGRAAAAPPSSRRSRRAAAAAGVAKAVRAAVGPTTARGRRLAVPTSRFTGVRRIRVGRWSAAFSYRRGGSRSFRSVYLGVFNDEVTAARVVDAATIVLRPADAPTNFPRASYTPAELAEAAVRANAPAALRARLEEEARRAACRRVDGRVSRAWTAVHEYLGLLVAMSLAVTAARR